MNWNTLGTSLLLAAFSLPGRTSYAQEDTLTTVATQLHTYVSTPTGLFANAYVLETERGVIVVDATLTVMDAKGLRARVDAIGKPLRAVFITHGHPDHYNGLTELLRGREEVPVYATPGVDRVIREWDARKEEQWKDTFGDEWPAVRTFPNRVLEDGVNVTVEGVRFTAHDLGPGESFHDAYWIARDGTKTYAFIGDLVFNQEHSYVSDGHTTEWLANLERVRGSLEGLALYPGHGPAGGSELLDAQRSYLERFREEVRRLAEGRSQLTESEKAELAARMSTYLPKGKLTFLIGAGADAVAAELARQQAYGNSTWTPGENRVEFMSSGDRLVGTLLLPPSFRPGQRIPLIVITGAWINVKEQMATTYARQLVDHGFAAMTFDFRGFGESEGQPRQWEDPERKIADLKAAARFAATLPFVREGDVGLLAICFGASYGAHAIAEGAPYRSFATIVPWFYDRASEIALFGEEEIARRYGVGRAARRHYERTGEVLYVPAVSTTDREAAMFGIDYYSRPERGLIPEWDNRFALMSWPEYLDLDGLVVAPRIRVPTLVVSSDSAGLPQNARRFYEALGGPKRLVWLTGEHTEFYDQEPQVSAASEAVVAHLAVTLRQGR